MANPGSPIKMAEKKKKEEVKEKAKSKVEIAQGASKEETTTTPAAVAESASPDTKGEAGTVDDKAEMYEYIKQDLTEFGVGPDDEDEEVPFLDLNAYRGNTKVQEKIDALALEESIFSDPSRKYTDWAWNFDLDWPEDEMEELLASNPNLRLMYSTMVPAKTDAHQFWARYFYHVNMILKAEREAERASVKQPKPHEDSDHKLAPTIEEPLDKSIGADIVDISEEDQKRLLMEYEEEMKKGHSRGSSGTQLSSSSSGSFAFVTHDLLTDEVKVE